MEKYDLMKTIGTGSFARVELAQNVSTKEYMAVKMIKKSRTLSLNQQAHTIWEYQILSQLSHPFIVEMREMFQDKSKLYFVMEYVIGGELFCLMKKAGQFKEIHCAFYCAQMVLALQYLHKNNIIYRALVPENILIDCQGYIKLTDFGFSKRLKLPLTLLHGYLRSHTAKKRRKFNDFSPKIIECIHSFAEISQTYTLCGTPEYVAPEILLNIGYSFAADWWSVGIIIYELMATFTPFSCACADNGDSVDSDSNADIYGNIINQNYRMKPDSFPKTHFSESCKDLLTHLLQMNPKKRLGSVCGAIDIMTHSFFKGINWYKLLQKNMRTVPWIPIVTNESDTLYFEEYEMEEEMDSDSDTNEIIVPKTDIFQTNNVFERTYFDNSVFENECKLVHFMTKQTESIQFNKNGLLSLSQFMDLLSVLHISEVYDENVLQRIFYFIQKNKDIPFLKRKQISFISYSNLIGCGYTQFVSIVADNNNKQGFNVVLSKLVLDQLQWVHNKILDGITRY